MPLALDDQTVVVPGTAAAEKVLRRLAGGLRDLLRQRDQAADRTTKQLGQLHGARPNLQ